MIWTVSGLVVHGLDEVSDLGMLISMVRQDLEKDCVLEHVG